MKRSVSILLVFALSCGVSYGVRAAGDDGEGNSRDTIQVVQEGARTRIRIPVRDGRVSWSEVLRGVSRAKGFDDDALKGLMGKETLDVTSTGGRFLLMGLNLALAPNLRFRLASTETGGPKDRLEIVLDRVAVLASKRRLREMLLGAFPRMVRKRGRSFGLRYDEGWERTPVDRGLMVLLHGIHSAPHQVSHVLGAVRELGIPCATFAYPNDQAIADSARLLSRELRKLAERQPERKLILLTHSMGGLVAREAVENPRLDPGNVRRLIMVAPPNQGSVMAHFAFGLEVWEHTVIRRDRPSVERLFAAIEDGLCEASDDLEPGSLFLRELNARPRNPKVRYALFLGSGAPLEKEDLKRLSESLQKLGDRNRFVRFFGSRLQRHLEDLEEVVRGQGDGAVAIRRGRLKGVTDVEVLDFDHLALWGEPRNRGARKLREVILKRLGESSGSSGGR